jgi:2,3-bisphosphoglycerate-independent phosphoglycerate mutase
MKRVEPQFVLLIPDGAGDRSRTAGATPLAAARLPAMDSIARRGVSGRCRTLYPELPKGSIVAQMGLLGWDPRRYCPHGRASCELLALEGPESLGPSDLAFRANLVRTRGSVLASYNADAIPSRIAAPLVDRINTGLDDRFPDFELYHNLDFRTTLVVRGARTDPRCFECLEPHEHQNRELDLEHLVGGRSRPAAALARRLNDYLAEVRTLLAREGTSANLLLPWSPSGPLHLPSFREHTGFEGTMAVVAAMDFLQGIARAGDMAFHKVGNGRVDTDYRAKGETTLELLEEGCRFVVCHVNAPDEAAHMGDVAAKVDALERIDRTVVAPVVDYFRRRPGALGCVALVPDHYTNSELGEAASRSEAHSLDPVPFALWNGRRRDRTDRFTEDAAAVGLYGPEPVSHLEILDLMGVIDNGRAND